MAMLATYAEGLSLYKTVDYCPSHLCAHFFFAIKAYFTTSTGHPQRSYNNSFLSVKKKRLWRPNVLCLNFTPRRSSILRFSNLNPKIAWMINGKRLSIAQFP